MEPRRTLGTLVLAVLIGTGLAHAGGPTPTPAPADHYKIYFVDQVPTPIPTPVVSLQDEIATVAAQVVEVTGLGVPVDKNDEGIMNAVEHLTFYRVTIAAPPVATLVLEFSDQFGPARTVQIASFPSFLAAPSEKAVNPSPLPTPALAPSIDHYACYGVNSPGPAVNQSVALQDQFGSTSRTVGFLDSFCVPVDKNGEGITNAEAHLSCYNLDFDPQFSAVNVTARDQFGAIPMRAFFEQKLCVPAMRLSLTGPSPMVTVTPGPTMSPVPPTSTPGESGSPAATPSPSPTATVTATETPVVTPTITGTPVATPTSTGTPVATATTTATATPTPSVSVTPTVTDAPTPTASPTTTPTVTATATATATVTPTVTVSPIVTPSPTVTAPVSPVASPSPGLLRSFSCYNVKREPFDEIADVQLADQFGSRPVEVRFPRRLCAPADVDGADPGAAADPGHLVGYSLRQTGTRFRRIRGVEVENAFGTITVEVVRPDLLLVPSSKSFSDPAPVLDPTAVDHFACYKVKRARTRLADVAVADQFGEVSVDVKRPLRLCNPVDKNGEGILDPAGHLMCYGVRTKTRSTRAAVFVANQFGDDALRLGKPREICLPSIKRPPPP